LGEQETEARERGEPWPGPELAHEILQDQREVEAHVLEWKVQIDVVNITFGQQLKPFSMTRPRDSIKTEADRRQVLNDQRTYLVAAERQCQDESAQLLNLVEK
jgi:hypothetical protein